MQLQKSCFGGLINISACWRFLMAWMCRKLWELVNIFWCQGTCKVSHVFETAHGFLCGVLCWPIILHAIGSAFVMITSSVCRSICCAVHCGWTIYPTRKMLQHVDWECSAGTVFSNLHQPYPLKHLTSWTIDVNAIWWISQRAVWLFVFAFF